MGLMTDYFEENDIDYEGKYCYECDNYAKDCICDEEENDLESEKETILFDLQEGYQHYEDLDYDYQHDMDVISLVIKQDRDGFFLELHADDELKDSEEVVLKSILVNSTTFIHASERLKNDEEFIITAIKEGAEVLEYASEAIKSNKEVVLFAVRNNGNELYYASQELQNNKEVVLAAVENEAEALGAASEELTNDKDIVFAAFSKDPYWALSYAGKDFFDNKEYVIHAMKFDKDGNIVEKISKTLLSDPEVAKALQDSKEYHAKVEKNCHSIEMGSTKLEELSEEFRDNKDIVEASIYKDPHSLQYSSQRLKNDVEILKLVGEQNAYALEFVGEEYKNNSAKVLEIVKTTCPQGLKFASEDLQDDRELVIQAVKYNGFALEYSSSRLQDDEEIVTLATGMFPEVIRYASQRLQEKLGY